MDNRKIKISQNTRDMSSIALMYYKVKIDYNIKNLKKRSYGPLNNVALELVKGIKEGIEEALKELESAGQSGEYTIKASEVEEALKSNPVRIDADIMNDEYLRTGIDIGFVDGVKFTLQRLGLDIDPEIEDVKRFQHNSFD